MTFDEVIQRCSSDFSFFLALLVWVSFFVGMAWSTGSEFITAVIDLIRKKWKDLTLLNRKR